MFNLSIVTLCLLAANFLGLLREVFIARNLGTGNDYDCFVAAFSIISFFLVLFNQQNIQSLFMPEYHKARLENINSSLQLKLKCSFYLTTITTIFSLIVYLGAPQIISFIFSSFNVNQINLSSTLLRIMVPIIVINATLGILHSYFHSHNRFSYPSMGQLVHSLVILILLFWGPLDVIWLAKIFLIAMITCWVFTAYPIIKSGEFIYASRIKLSEASSLKHRFLRDGCFILMISCVEQLMQLWIKSCFASFGDGTLSEVGYVLKIISFPIYLIGYSVSTTFFPHFIEEIKIQTKNTKVIQASCQIMLMLLSLAASFLYFFADPITLILFGGSAISQASLISIAELMQWFSPYIVVAGLNIYLLRLNYLCQQSGALLIATILIASVQVGLTLMLKPVLGIGSIPACAIIANFILIIVQHKFLKRNQINVLNWSEFLWATLPGLASTLLSWLLSKSLSISLASLIFYAAACLFLNLGVLYFHKSSFIYSFIHQSKKR